MSGHGLSRGGQWMKFDSEARVNILTVGTALVVALVRHVISKTPWGGVSQLLSWWFIHTIALFLLVLGASFIIDRWHRTFLGEDGNVLENRVQFQYYIAMTSLVAAVAIFIVKTAGPFSELDDY
jgi:hypothetical protein